MMDEKKVMLENFYKRRDEAAGKPRVNNADLDAGSPMYFYCRGCGCLSDELSEGYTERPRRWCSPCKEMNRLGLLDDYGRRVE